MFSQLLDVSQVGQSQHVGLSVDLVDGHNTSKSQFTTICTTVCATNGISCVPSLLCGLALIIKLYKYGIETKLWNTFLYVKSPYGKVKRAHIILCFMY